MLTGDQLCNHKFRFVSLFIYVSIILFHYSYRLNMHKSIYLQTNFPRKVQELHYNITIIMYTTFYIIVKCVIYIPRYLINIIIIS